MIGLSLEYHPPFIIHHHHVFRQPPSQLPCCFLILMPINYTAIYIFFQYYNILFETKKIQYFANYPRQGVGRADTSSIVSTFDLENACQTNVGIQKSKTKHENKTKRHHINHIYCNSHSERIDKNMKLSKSI